MAGSPVSIWHNTSGTVHQSARDCQALLTGSPVSIWHNTSGTVHQSARDCWLGHQFPSGTTHQAQYISLPGTARDCWLGHQFPSGTTHQAQYISLPGTVGWVTSFHLAQHIWHNTLLYATACWGAESAFIKSNEPC